uniref:DNA helicase n=1 Tax=Parastrongyloides trichosuri TaxID=131310 RepID=A0A0N5A5Z0_PARTI
MADAPRHGGRRHRRHHAADPAGPEDASGSAAGDFARLERADPDDGRDDEAAAGLRHLPDRAAGLDPLPPGAEPGLDAADPQQRPGRSRQRRQDHPGLRRTDDGGQLHHRGDHLRHPAGGELRRHHQGRDPRPADRGAAARHAGHGGRQHLCAADGRRRSGDADSGHYRFGRGGFPRDQGRGRGFGRQGLRGPVGDQSGIAGGGVRHGGPDRPDPRHAAAAVRGTGAGDGLHGVETRPRPVEAAARRAGGSQAQGGCRGAHLHRPDHRRGEDRTGLRPAGSDQRSGGAAPDGPDPRPAPIAGPGIRLRHAQRAHPRQHAPAQSGLRHPHQGDGRRIGRGASVLPDGDGPCGTSAGPRPAEAAPRRAGGPEAEGGCRGADLHRPDHRRGEDRAGLRPAGADQRPGRPPPDGPDPRPAPFAGAGVRLRHAQRAHPRQHAPAQSGLRHPHQGDGRRIGRGASVLPDGDGPCGTSEAVEGVEGRGAEAGRGADPLGRHRDDASARPAGPAAREGVDPRPARHPRRPGRGRAAHHQRLHPGRARPQPSGASAVLAAQGRRRRPAHRHPVARVGASLRRQSGRSRRRQAAGDGAQQTSGLHPRRARCVRARRHDGREPGPADRAAGAPLRPLHHRTLPGPDGGDEPE